MSKISFELTRLDVTQKGNYFLLVQLDETEFPSKLRRTQKYRTEIDYSTEFPQFHKNYFEFTNVQLGNKLVIRIGLFTFNNVSTITQEQKRTNNIPPKLLFDNSSLQGSVDVLISSEWIDLLRKSKFVETDVRLIHPEVRQKETGHAFFKLNTKSQTLDTKIYEDNKEIEKVFYDPFEKDKKKISEKLKMIIILNEEKQFELDKIQKKLDKANNQAAFASRDKSKVESELKAEENENTMLKRQLLKIQNYDEIHIEIDLLSQSPQGVEIIEKKYAVLLGQYSLQKQIRFEYENQYKEIEPLMTKINIIKNRFGVVQQANKELKFHFKRHQDMLPLLLTYQEKIKNNDKLIENYKNNIKDILDIRNGNSPLSVEEITKRIDLFDKERKKLEEKKIQMNLYLEVYFKEHQGSNKTYSELSEPFYRIIGTDPTMNRILTDSEVEVLENNKKRIKELEEQAKILSKQITDFDQKEKEKKEKGIVIEPSLILRRNNLRDKLEIEEKKAKFILGEMDKNKAAFLSAKEILKDKIAHYDDIIERELKFARLRKYEDDVNFNNARVYYDYNNQ